MILAFVGCSGIPERDTRPPDACAALFAALDAAIRAETHFDPSLRRVTGMPLARTDRFLAGFEYDSLQPAARQAWLEHAFGRAQAAYRTEFARLQPETRAAIRSAHGFESLEARLSDCFGQAQAPEELPASAYGVPDNYSTALRALGLYPLTRLIARGFIARYREDMTARVEAGPATEFVAQQTYEGRQPEVAGDRPTRPLATDALGVPRLTGEDWDVLFDRHMPQIVSELGSAADRIGKPRVHADGRIRIDTEHPTVFTFPSHMPRSGQVLPQLNYVFWFPARPPATGFDLYAGELAGILWRVTLDQQLRPVLYDSIHLCGCYHKLFLPPGSRVDLKGLAGERPLVFALDGLPDSHVRLQLRVAAATHYLIEVRTAQPDPQALSLAVEPYESLLRSPGPDGAVSVFGPTGIIQQSRRPERFFLWPMGIPSPGAMRQRGMHATAFAGRRHFDAPDLLDALQLTFD